MILTLIFLTAVSVYCEVPCSHKYTAIDITDYKDVLGNWTQLYTWGGMGWESPPDDVNRTCLTLTVSIPYIDEIQRTIKLCKQITYNWVAVILKITMYDSSLDFENFSYFTPTNETGQLVTSDCMKSNIYFKKISDEFIVVHDVKKISIEFRPLLALYGRRTPPDDELDCLVKGIDIVKGFNGKRRC